jgi:tryptophan synthase alpha chain
MSGLDDLFAATRAEGRAALIGYLPAGFPTVAGSKDLIAACVDGGADLIEVGVPYSDPVMDGPTIQAASVTALDNGFRLKHLFEVVESVSARGGRAVVMTYWNPVNRYGVDRFARDLASAGGLGLITPDLIPDEAGAWLSASKEHGLDRTFLVAPSSSEERLALTAAASSGFIYATAVMGVSLGVRSGEQAAQVASFADAVIVGSALVTAAAEGPTGVRALSAELAEGVRRAVATA